MMRAFIQDLLLKTPRSVDVSAALHMQQRRSFDWSESRCR
jgi:hypothetical protein